MYVEIQTIDGLHMEKENAWQYSVRSHPGLVDLFVSEARRQWDALGLYDSSHCDSERGGQIDYTGRILSRINDVLYEYNKSFNVLIN